MEKERMIRCEIHCQKGKEIEAEFSGDTGIYDKDGIYIEAAENLTDGCLLGKIRLEMKNQACRENFNLSGSNSPQLCCVTN